MILLALPCALARTVVHAVPDIEVLRINPNDDETMSRSCAHASHSTLLVIDPLLFRGDSIVITRAANTFASTNARIVFYTTFSRESMQAIVYTSILCPLDLWLVGHDDCTPGFPTRIQRAAALRPVTSVLDALELLRPALPAVVNLAISSVFRSPERFFDALDVARCFGCSRRNLDRHLVRGGFATARRLVIGAKVLHGAIRLANHGVRKTATLRSVAASLGYTDAEVFSRQYAEVFGVRPGGCSTPSEARTISSVLSYVRPNAIRREMGIVEGNLLLQTARKCGGPEMSIDCGGRSVA